MVLNMATYDYNVVSDQHLGHKKPMTLQQGRALRDNLLASFEGAPGAPKLHGRAVNIALGNLNGGNAIGDLWFAGQVLLVASAMQSVSNSVASAWVGYQISNNNGASWSATVTLATVANSMGNEGTTSTATATGSRLIDMWDYNAIRLVGLGSLSGSLICVRGQ